MAVPLLDLRPQHEPMLEDLGRRFIELVRSGRFILGPEVEAFECELASCCGAAEAIGMSSGSDALLAALMALGVGPGDEVVTTPFTFVATVGAIVRLGARPVFIDIEPDTFNLDARRLDAAITPATRAIVPVHLYGQMADMSPIMATARARGLKVVEDAAQAIGADTGGRRAGAIGDVGCFSFYPSKNLAAIGDAGACTVNDPALAGRLRVLRDHGQHPRYCYRTVGGNFRLDAVQAMVLRAKLARLDAWTGARRAHAARYRERLQDLPVGLPAEAPGRSHVYNQFTLRMPPARRDGLAAHFAARDIGHCIYYPRPLHLQPALAHLGHAAGDFPVSETAAAEVLSLPIFPELTRAQQDEVIAAIREFCA